MTFFVSDVLQSSEISKEKVRNNSSSRARYVANRYIGSSQMYSIIPMYSMYSITQCTPLHFIYRVLFFAVKYSKIPIASQITFRPFLLCACFLLGTFCSPATGDVVWQTRMFLLDFSFYQGLVTLCQRPYNNYFGMFRHET
jgi:hypothetical protein